ncbi:type II toxin-antitoxin system VapC family toxin [Natronococcus sp.]|uniref:type II toxin-antitoxin system VapC family toxin n=1 Tax=Natronococcus sp. TaxID=35747 RepID=UPI003A4D2EC8
MILDTSFLIDVLRGNEEVETTVQRVDSAGSAHVSAVTVMELWEGIHRSSASERERTAVENLLIDVRELPFDRDCAMTAGELNATLSRAGTPIEDPDVMIAATALVHDIPVVTNNVDHFDRIDDLEILTY